MTRALPRSIALLAVACLSLAGGTRAQQQSIGGTPAELEAYELYGQDQLLTARTKAEGVLASNPDSMVGHYVLGCVLREAEGSLARAMYHLGRARELYEARYGTVMRPAGAPWQLHRETLYAIQQLAGEMEDYEYQLQILDFYDSLYDPVLTAEHAWPLLHLGRFAEARAFAQRATLSTDPFQKSLGLNALCAIEGEAREREAAVTACNAALAAARVRRAESTETSPAAAPSLTVHAYNAAISAWGALRLSEVESLAREGAARLEFTTANPHRLLARLYTDQGKFDQAIESVRGMQTWRARQPAQLRDQDHADTDAALALVLLATSEPEVGLRAIDRAILRPDRRGLTSTRVEATVGAHALVRRALVRVQAELDAERAATRGFFGRVGGRFENVGTRTTAFPDDERIRGVLGNDDRLVATLRTRVSGGLEPLPTWLVGDLVQVLGAGVVSVGLRRARQLDARFAAVRPYHDAIEAEVALAQGDETRALRLADQSLAQLPASEALLSARVALVAAQAAESQGRPRAALAYYERAMQRDPGAVRRMRLSLPGHVRGVGGDAAQAAADMIARGPRFRDTAHAFEVTVEQLGPGLRSCFRSPDGVLLGCATVAPEVRQAERGQPPPPPETTDELAARMADELHALAFGPKLTGSNHDLRSLDGSTLPSEDQSRERMRGLLDQISAQ